MGCTLSGIHGHGSQMSIEAVAAEIRRRKDAYRSPTKSAADPSRSMSPSPEPIALPPSGKLSPLRILECEDNPPPYRSRPGTGDGYAIPTVRLNSPVDWHSEAENQTDTTSLASVLGNSRTDSSAAPGSTIGLIQPHLAVQDFISVYKVLFHRLDVDRSGRVPVGRLREAVEERFGRDVSMLEFEDSLRRLGVGPDSAISWDEFLIVCAVAKVPVDANKIQAMRYAFDQIDENHNGRIEVSELKRALAKLLGEEPSGDLMHAIMNKADYNHDGLITFDEFIGTLYAWFQMLSELGATAPRDKLIEVAHELAEMNW